MGLETVPIKQAQYGIASYFDNLKLTNTSSNAVIFSDTFESAAYSGEPQYYRASENNWSVMSRLKRPKFPAK
ncbi:hypothetical protein BK138_02255 [Paenibacillus rhizosphaerae]|uniref:Uncharacterized protein n=1 Tax=Paenibacillus rhizosphaerae TaxID=297318 RepID=A0A1R1F050_9BACL|nr:hypothetical protein BK138_02255 [Paenibacillus rhizosphaerae]